MAKGGYNVIRSRDGNYIAGRWRLYVRLSEGKSAEFIPEKKKNRNICAREVAKTRLFQQLP